MTKANEKAKQRVADAERRVRRKLKRLQKKGVRTGGINPLSDVSPSDTRALNRYARDLEKFISRETRFVTGRDGTPIPYSAYRDYKRVEREWNKYHSKYWAKFSDKPFITAYGESDMTLGQRSAMTHIAGLPYGNIGGERDIAPEQLQSVADIEKRIKIMKREMSPSYQMKRVRELRKNMLAHAETFNDPTLPNMIKKLSNNQLFALQNFTNFVPLYYRYIETDKDNTMGVQADATDSAAQIEHMKLTIEQVKRLHPNDAKAKGKGKRK